MNQRQFMSEPPAPGGPTGPVGAPAAPEGPLSLEEMAERAPRIARAIFRGKDKDFIDEVCQRALTSLLRRFTAVYLWSTIKNTGFSYLRENSPDDGVECVAEVPERSPSPESPFERVPPVVTSTRLRIVNESEPVEAIAFGYHTYLGWSATDIALNLATVSLDDLARSLIETCARAATVETAQFSRAFPVLQSIIGTSEGAMTLQDHWKPEIALRKWVADVESAIWPPDGVAVPPDAPMDLTRAMDKPPNRRIAFAYGNKDGLDCRIPGIVSQCGNMSLESLQVEFESRYPARIPSPRLSLEEWEPFIRMEGKAAKRALQQYYSPRRAISTWVEKTVNALESEERKQEKHGLGRIFKYGRIQPHEAMAMLYTREGFLAVDPHDAWKIFAQRNNWLEVESSLRERYAKKWGFEEDHVDTWFEPLRKRLGGPQGSPSVNSVFPDPPSIRSAQEKVSRIIQRWFGKGKESPLFGWRHKLL